MLTILTPTYNRKETIKKLYSSLVLQTDYNFQWLIIDDGSIDNTKEVVSEFDNSKFQIDYFFKENGGKHTALNFFHQYIKGSWVFVVDSDDLLTKYAVEMVNSYIEKYDCNKKIGSFAFLKSDSEGRILALQIYKEDYISNAIDYRINRNIRGDQAEVYRTDILKKFKFPVFKDEKFLGEDYLHINAAYIFDTVYVNKIIYIAEYRADGLTKAGRRMRIQNPLGGMLRGSLYFSNRFKLKYRIKGMILYICYGMFANKKSSILFKDCNKYKCLYLVSYPMALILNLFWRYKYK